MSTGMSTRSWVWVPWVPDHEYGYRNMYFTRSQVQDWVRVRKIVLGYGYSMSTSTGTTTLFYAEF